MKKEKLYKVMYFISIVLILLFFVFVGIDYSKYDSLIYSAPFTAYILIRMIEFILPSMIIFIIGVACKNKLSNKK